MSLIYVLSSVLGAILCAQFTSELRTSSRYLLPFVAFLTLQTILSIAYHVILYPFYLSSLRHLPSPKQGPLWNRFLKEPSPTVLCKWINEVPNDGLIRYFGLFNREQILLTRPQGCKEVLQTHAYNFIKFPWALEIMGQVTGSLGLLVAPPKKHKVDRKLMQPAFKAPYIKSLYPTFWNETSKFLIAVEKRLAAGLDTSVVDIGKMLHYVTLDIVTLTGFGGSVHAVDNPDSEQIKEYCNLFSAKRAHINYRLLAMAVPYWLHRWLPMSARYEINSAVSSVHANMLPLVQDRRESSIGSNTEDKKESNAHEKGDIIATLLRSGNTFSDAYLLDQAVGFIIAGQETTAVAVSFALYLLSLNPEVQTRLRAEIRSNFVSPNHDVLGKGSSAGLNVDSNDVDSLPYLTAVCNEALRIYTPVPDARRLTTSPNTFIEGTLIPVGTVVTVAPWVIHRSKAVWGPNAEEFDPERWFVPGSGSGKQKLKIDPTGGSGDPYAVMTFTYGARACIGERFARAEMATLVAQLVGRFEWKFKGIGVKGDKEMKLAFGVTLATVGGGMTMEASRIEGW